MEKEMPWVAARNGDQAAIEQIAERYYKVAYNIAYKWRGILEIDDLLSAADTALMKCIRGKSFDPEKAKFSTYLSRAVENEIRMMLRWRRRHCMDKVVSFEDPICSGDGTLKLEDILQDARAFDDIACDSVILQKIEAVKEKIDEMAWKCLLFAISGYTQKEIAEKVKYSQTHVSRLIRKARQVIQEEVGTEYYVGG